MTATDWAHLPNAVHIDRVLASVKANPEQWLQVRFDENNTAWLAYSAQRRRLELYDTLNEQGRRSSWVAARDAVQVSAQGEIGTQKWLEVRNAILALIAYDDCAYMLDSDPGELAILAKFDDHRAILLLTACKVFHLLKTIA